MLDKESILKYLRGAQQTYSAKEKLAVEEITKKSCLEAVQAFAIAAAIVAQHDFGDQA